MLLLPLFFCFVTHLLCFSVVFSESRELVCCKEKQTDDFFELYIFFCVASLPVALRTVRLSQTFRVLSRLFLCQKLLHDTVVYSG